MNDFDWLNKAPLPELTYDCGFCCRNVAATFGYQGRHPGSPEGDRRVYLCPFCEMPSVVLSGRLVISPKEIEHG